MDILKSFGNGNEIAAVTLQKMYRGYRTRRMLADSAIAAQDLWWQAIDHVKLSHSTISFFENSEPESVASRWNRISSNASKVGKGICKDAKADKMFFEHWLEAIDPRHRYGKLLYSYYNKWSKTDSSQPFFYWLDVGDGKELDLKECPRSKLQQQCIKYLGPQEREQYEYIIVDGKIAHKLSGNLLDTSMGSEQGSEWIFVMSPSKRLYAGATTIGKFHHSSFLSGGASIAAGELIVENGILKFISPNSGHYRPTKDRFQSFVSFLKDNGVNLDEVQVDHHLRASETKDEHYKRNMSAGLESPRVNETITTLKGMNSLNWSSGTGARIDCLADLPS